MTGRSRHPIALACAAIAIALSVAGCGDADAEEQRTGGVTEAFVDLVDELKVAVRSGEELEAAFARTAELESKETKALRAFCHTLWELEVNREEELFSEPDRLVARMKKLAEYRFAEKDSPTVEAALAHLRRETDLASISPGENRRYVDACGAGEWPDWR